jgi:hypothetical protein
VLIEHDGRHELEMTLDRGTPEEAREFITAAREKFPLIAA